MLAVDAAIVIAAVVGVVQLEVYLKLKFRSSSRSSPLEDATINKMLYSIWNLG